MAETWRSGIVARNPAWVQLLGLCPLLAVSHTLATALGLAAASALVLIVSATTVSVLRGVIATAFRLPVFVLVIATATTVADRLLEAYAFELYARVALFVQIIVTNCMILARLETFASQVGPARAALDALGTALGFALALIALGATRELLAYGSLGAGLPALLGEVAADWTLELGGGWSLETIALPPGAFIVAGVLLALGRSLTQRRRSEDT